MVKGGIKNEHLLLSYVSQPNKHISKVRSLQQNISKALAIWILAFVYLNSSIWYTLQIENKLGYSKHVHCGLS